MYRLKPAASQIQVRAALAILLLFVVMTSAINTKPSLWITAFDFFSKRIRNKWIDRKYVKDIPFPLLGSLLVVRRENEVFIPHGDTYLLLGDRVTVIGKDSALEEFRKLFE